MVEDRERSLQLYLKRTESSEKLDYFILGATLAICAYLAQTNPYARVGVNEETLLLISLLIFTGSAVCGFKRIQAKVDLMIIQAKVMTRKDGSNNDVYMQHQLKLQRKSAFLYFSRNYLLMFGLLFYIVTKVWATYQTDGWIPV